MARERFFRSRNGTGFTFYNMEQATRFMRLFDHSDKTLISLHNDWESNPAPCDTEKGQLTLVRPCVLCSSPNASRKVKSESVKDGIREKHLERGNGTESCLTCGFSVEGISRADHSSSHGRCSQLLPEWEEEVWNRVEDVDLLFDHYVVSFADAYEEEEGEEAETEFKRRVRMLNQH